MRRDIFFDDIIFVLQEFGGISTYWREVTKGPHESKSKRGTPGRAIFSFSFTKSLKGFLKFLPVFWVREHVYHSSYQRPVLFKCSTKIVVTIHDCMYELFESGLRRSIHVFYTRWALGQADVVICVSESTKRDLISLYPEVRRNDIRVIHNGFDAELGEKEITLPQDEFLLYVGKRGYCKNFLGQMSLVSGYAASSDCSIILVGGGELSALERNKLAQLGILNRITHFQGLSNEEVKFLMSEAKALLFLSRYEGFGIPVVEAFNAGCPVLGSNTSSIPEIAGSDYPGLFELEDEVGVTEFLRRIEDEVHLKSVRKYMKDRSRAFSWTRSREAHTLIYQELLC